VRQGRGSARACHTVAGEGEKGGGVADVVRTRLTGEAERQRGPVVSGGVRERVGEKSRVATGHRHTSSGGTVPGGADSNRISNKI
jgi:hypothetical protein